VTERADATYGKGWSAKVDNELHDLKESGKRIEGKIGTFLSRQTEWFEEDKKRWERAEKRFAYLEDGDEDDDEITGVHSVEAIKRRARMMRARNRRWNRNAKIAAPGLVGIGVALAELVRQIIAMRGH
jgi:hypothetical protein